MLGNLISKFRSANRVDRYCAPTLDPWIEKAQYGIGDFCDSCFCFFGKENFRFYFLAQAFANLHGKRRQGEIYSKNKDLYATDL